MKFGFEETGPPPRSPRRVAEGWLGVRVRVSVVRVRYGTYNNNGESQYSQLTYGLGKVIKKYSG